MFRYEAMYMINYSKLDAFAKALRPEQNEVNALKSTLNSLETVLKKSASFKVKKTVGGGSLAKGTMLKGNFEADIVFIVDRKGSSYDKIMSNVEKTVKSNYQHRSGLKRKKVAVTLELAKPINRITIDILAGYEVNSPQQMASVKNSKYFQGSTAIFHNKYAKVQKGKESRFGDVVRVLKYWNKKSNLSLSGFQIELLAANGIEHSPSRDLFDYVKTSYKTIQSMCDGKTVYPVNWDSYFKAGAVSATKSGAGVLLVNPGDPSHNAASSLTGTEVNTIRSAASREICFMDR